MDKTVPMIVKYVPTSYKIDALTENRKIEQNSGIG